MQKRKPQVRSDVNENRMVSMRDVTFAGPRGYELLADLQRVSTGLIDVHDAAPEVTRRSDGILRLKVTSTTVDVIAGRADVVDPDEAETPKP